MSEQQNINLSFFQCILCSIGAIWTEYSTYTMYLGDGYQPIHSCHSALCRLGEWAFPVIAPMGAIMLFYILFKHAPLMWFIAQILVVYFIFF